MATMLDENTKRANEKASQGEEEGGRGEKGLAQQQLGDNDGFSSEPLEGAETRSGVIHEVGLLECQGALQRIEERNYKEVSAGLGHYSCVYRRPCWRIVRHKIAGWWGKDFRWVICQ